MYVNKNITLWFKMNSIEIVFNFAQSAGAVEYTDCISAEG